MNTDKTGLFSLILKVCLLGIITILCVLVYGFFRENVFVVSFTFSASALAFGYVIVREKFAKEAKVRLDEMIYCLSYLTKETGQADSLLRKQPELFEVYEKTEQIKQLTLRKELDRQRVFSIVNSVAVNMEIDSILSELMPKLIDVTKSNCAAFYLANHGSSKLEIKKSVGFSKNIYSEFDIVLGEGFIGSSAINKEINIITDIPDDTVYTMRTFLGMVKPKSIMVVPIVNQEILVGIFAFASINDYSKAQLDIVNLIKYYVGAAVGNGITFEKTKRLSSELKFQNRLIQNLNDDLEQKVHDRTSFLNNIIDTLTGHAIYTFDNDGIIKVWNKAAENLYGLSSKNTIGKHVKTIYPSHEDGVESMKKRMEIVLSEGKFFETGWSFRGDGSKFFSETVMFARINEKNEVASFTSITQDITDVKNLESSLRCEKDLSAKLIEMSNLALVITDECGIVLSLNSRTNQFIGENILVGESVQEYFCENSLSNIIGGEKTSLAARTKNSNRQINISGEIITSKEDFRKIVCLVFADI